MTAKPNGNKIVFQSFILHSPNMKVLHKIPVGLYKWMPSLRCDLFSVFQGVWEGFYSAKHICIKILLVFSNLSEFPIVKGENSVDYMQGGQLYAWITCMDKEKGRSQTSMYISLTSMCLVRVLFYTRMNFSLCLQNHNKLKEQPT